MEFSLKNFVSRRAVFALCFAVAVVFARQASAQTTNITDYQDLITALNSGVTTITNFQAPLTINVNTNGNATIQITNNVVIDAGTNAVAFNGHGETRIFYVYPNASLTLNGIILSNGFSTNGGAIYNAGTLIISNCVLETNVAANANGATGAAGPFAAISDGGSGGKGSPAEGGAIYSTGPMAIYSSILTNNFAEAGNGGNGGNANGEAGNGGNGGYGGNASGGAIYSTGSNNIFYMTEFMSNQCFAGIGGSGGFFATNGFQGPIGSNGEAGLGGASAGGAVFLSGPLQMTNCLFANNFAQGGQTGNAQLNSTGGGEEGSPGGVALGGGLFITNGPAIASIVNTIFFTNICSGGTGGSTALNAAVGGTGGAAQGGGVWSGAARVQMSFCTLAFNYAYGGNGGANSDGGISGTQGAETGHLIYRAAGVFDLEASLLSFLTSGSYSTVSGVTDLGYNICSDSSLAKSSVITTTRLSTAPRLETALDQYGIIVGGTNFGSQIFTLPVLSNSPAIAFVPGVPGVTFPATDQVLQDRPTPATAGAFEGNPASIQTNAVPANLILSTLPAIILTGSGRTVAFSNAVNFNIYTNPLALGYQWQLNGTNITDNGNYSGTVSNILTIKDSSAGDQGLYTIIVSPTLLEGALSNTVELLLTNPPAIITQPVNQSNRPSGAIVTFTVNVGSFPEGYYYQWLYSTNSSSEPVTLTNLEGGDIFITNNILTIDPATAANAGSYSVIISNGFGTNDFGSKTSSVVHLTIVPDNTRPKITITSPSPKHYNSRTNSVAIAGIASDNAQVAYVRYWFTNINPGLNPATNVMTNYAALTTDSTNLNGPVTNFWSITNLPLPGTNIFTVQSVDFSSNVSTVATLKFFYEVSATLSLTTNSSGGAGTLTPHSFIKGDALPTNRASLNIGEGYSIVASPNSASLLGSWTITNTTASNVVTTVTNGNTLKFVMETNTSILATFVNNPFPATGVHGTYNGLFYILPDFVTNDYSTNQVVGTNGMTNQVVTTNAIYTNELTFDSSGMLKNLSVNKEGAFSGSLLLAGYSYGLSGSFDALGYLTNFLVNRAIDRGGPLLLDLNISTNGAGIITGSISNAEWPGSAYLWATLPVTSAGTTNYTMLLPAPTNSETNSSIPPGDGYGLITYHNGNATLSGGLADGTTYSQSAPVLQSNDIPVYISLYSKTGFLFGWLNLTNIGSTNPPDELLWVKGTASKPNTLFGGGFTNMLPAVGSIWTNPLVVTLLASTNLAISSSNLNLSYTVAITNKDKLINAAPGTPTNSLTGTFNLKNGLLQVTFGDGDKRSTLKGYGVMLQNTNYTGGYFVTKTNAGSISLSVSGQTLVIPQASD